ncbi:MAG: hypothetical protein WAJ96_07790 [Candidatus Acidiferrum sp.]
MTAPIAGDPVNTYTAAIADAHSHTVTFAGINGRSKQDALLAVAQIDGQALGALTTTDTWTVTITQP